MAHARWTRPQRATAAVVLACFCLNLLPLRGVAAAPAAPCEGKDAPARIYQDAMGPEEALARLTSLIDSGKLPRGECLRDAYVYKARCESDLGRVEAAQLTFCSVLRLDPTWRPKARDFTPADVAAFNRALEACTPAPKRKPPYLLYGLGAVGAGLLVAVLAGGKGGTNNGGPPPVVLPGFPSPPK